MKLTNSSKEDLLHDPQQVSPHRRNNFSADSRRPQVLALEQAMQDDFRQLRTPLNHARPINRLPSEVLSIIFRLAAGPAKSPDLRDALRLSSICRIWRRLFLETVPCGLISVSPARIRASLLSKWNAVGGSPFTSSSTCHTRHSRLRVSRFWPTSSGSLR